MLDPSITDSALDPVTWLVWADWLEEHGDEVVGTRARNIARGLEKHPKGLYLQFRLHQGPCDAMICGHEDGSTVLGREFPSRSITYQWSGQSAHHTLSPPVVHPVSPLSHPKALSIRPDLILSFWDKLEELGRAP